MKAIEILAHEHDLISHYLTLLTLATEKVLRNQNPPADFFAKAVNFYHKFTHDWHHIKEEYVLFALLAQKHSGEIDAEIEKLHSQHEQGRNFMAAISTALPSYAQGQEPAARAVFSNTGEYVRAMRRHIDAEEKVFYPLVKRTINEAEHQFVLGEYERYEKKAGADALPDARELLLQMTALL